MAVSKVGWFTSKARADFWSFEAHLQGKPLLI
jgi:hypothetical protein